MSGKPLVFLTVFVVGAALFLSGCVQTRAYLMEKERVDQDVQGITPPAIPKTRQIIVLEITEKNKGQPDIKMLSSSGIKNKSWDNVSSTETGSGTLTKGNPVVTLPIEYKVEKDDTLQKISKRLYGSFGQWTKIYDANKELIKDPNFLKTGTVLKIPAAE